MAHAFDDVCASLQIPNIATKAREMIAKRVIRKKTTEGQMHSSCSLFGHTLNFP